MSKNQAAQAAAKKLASAPGPKSVGSEPPKNFGHASAKSEGVSGKIPNKS